MSIAVTEKLTDREIQILQLLADGKTYDEVATVTRLAPQTIANYTQTLREKFSAPTTIHVVAIAFREQKIR